MQSNRNYIRSLRTALDMDTALEDGQWGKLKEFLSDKLQGDDLETVENICRKGGDAPDAGEDRKRPNGGASDTAMQRVERHRGEVREKHRQGLISDAQLPAALEYGRATSSAPKPAPIAYDEKRFPHASRLK